MNEQHRDNNGDRWLWEFDAAPRDGPAVFIAERAAYDERAEIRGRWLDPTTLDEETVGAQIAEVVGAPIEGRWAVIDQFGLGPRSLPEEPSVRDLCRMSRRMADHKPARHLNAKEAR